MNFNEKQIQFFMERALVQARKGLNLKEVPVGCVVVRNDQIIAESHNLTNQNSDPIAHAEILCVKSTDCSNCAVFLTCEPCIMCFGVLNRLGCKIYFGCYNSTFGCSILRETKNIFVPNQECIDILRKFYKMENENAPIEKRKLKNGK